MLHASSCSLTPRNPLPLSLPNKNNKTTKTTKQQNNKTTQGVKMILRDSGPAGLYQGLAATILKQSTNQGFRFMAFNKYEEFMAASYTGGAKLSALQVSVHLCSRGSGSCPPKHADIRRRRSCLLLSSAMT